MSDATRTLADVIKANRGHADEKPDTHWFNPEDGPALAKDLGFHLPATGHIVFLSALGDRVTIRIPALKADPDFAGWRKIGKRDPHWSRVIQTDLANENEFDDKIRATLVNNVRAAWFIRHNNGSWNSCPRSECENVVYSHTKSRPRSSAVIGVAAMTAWELVNLPFQPEYPGERLWNPNAPQLRFEPVYGPTFPHWQKIMDHCGRDLDESLATLNIPGIKTGADYLMAWAASMFREPLNKLPYLFFHGPENSGKSIFHESLSLLMTKGVVAADRALTNGNDQNGELANGVLAFIEEKDISLSRGAYNKLKDWVTSETIWIRKMRTDVYPQVNTLHFVHCSNDAESCKIKSGDTRITAIYVEALPPGEEIPKPILIEQLKAEAPAFLYKLKTMKLPPMVGRLRLPAIESATKFRISKQTAPPLADAIEDFMSDRKTWTGTSRQLSKLLNCPACPEDARLFRRATEGETGSYLRGRGIQVSDGPRNKDGIRFKISKS